MMFFVYLNVVLVASFEFRVISHVVDPVSIPSHLSRFCSICVLPESSTFDSDCCHIQASTVITPFIPATSRCVNVPSCKVSKVSKVSMVSPQSSIKDILTVDFFLSPEGPDFLSSTGPSYVDISITRKLVVSVKS